MSRLQFTPTALVLLAVALALLSWAIAGVLFTVFGGILLAVALCAATDALAARLPGGRGWALAGVLLVAVALLAALVIYVVPQFVSQLDQLASQLADIFGRLLGWLRQQPIVEATAPEDGSEGGGMGSLVQTMLGSARQAAGVAAGAAMGFVGVLTTLGLVVILGVFIAADPRLYVGGLVRLVPQARRARAREVLGLIGHGLRGWLLGQFVSMTALGVATAITLYLAGLELWLALAVLTGLLTFVPFIGSIVAGIAMVAIAFAEGVQTGLIVLAFYLVLQAVESNLLTPLVQQRAVQMPPALLLGVQLALGALFGLPGLVLGAPLAVVLLVAVNTLYIEDALGDERALP